MSHPAYISALESFKSSLNEEWKFCSFQRGWHKGRPASCSDPDVTLAEIATSAGSEARPEVHRDGFGVCLHPQHIPPALQSCPHRPCWQPRHSMEHPEPPGAARAGIHPGPCCSHTGATPGCAGGTCAQLLLAFSLPSLHPSRWGRVETERRAGFSQLCLPLTAQGFVCRALPSRKKRVHSQISA